MFFVLYRSVRHLFHKFCVYGLQCFHGSWPTVIVCDAFDLPVNAFTAIGITQLWQSYSGLWLATLFRWSTVVPCYFGVFHGCDLCILLALSCHMCSTVETYPFQVFHGCDLATAFFSAVTCDLFHVFYAFCLQLVFQACQLLFPGLWPAPFFVDSSAGPGSITEPWPTFFKGSVAVSYTHLTLPTRFAV